jgi:uncharacterized protein YciI
MQGSCRNGDEPIEQEEWEPMANTYIVMSSAGPQRDLARGARDQAYWTEHGVFIDALVDAGFIMMGGPLVDEGGALMVVRAESEEEVRERDDPWYEHGILVLASIRRWDIFIDRRD